MLFSFADFTLDVERRELRRGSELVAVEPQVFDVLLYLIQNRDRVVSKDDLNAEVWKGRIVSESTLTSRINAARRAVGDNGDQQRLIRTVTRKGFRFVADLHEDATVQPRSDLSAVPSVSPRAELLDGRLEISDEGLRIDASTAQRASVAVMPFLDLSPLVSGPGGLGDGLAHDVITRLSKLRSVFVIAQGTVFALRERKLSPVEAARMLSVDYVVSGFVRRQNNRITVEVELADAVTARIVWAESFNRTIDDAFQVLEEVGNRVVASIASEIEALERNRAILRPPDSLNAWQAYHRGLWHVYRFSRADNEQAHHFFSKAIQLDPTFARAHAGLSFTHWQSAFQGWAERKQEVERAYAAAGQSLMADDRDPAAHMAMGRALWLRGDHEQCLVELNEAVDLSPNYALAHYSLAFVNSTGGDPVAAISSAGQSRRLSPFDPMLFGMLASTAMALVRMGRFQEAADWGVRAAARPNAHPHIHAIAAYSLALAQRGEEALSHIKKVRNALPRYRVDDLIMAMQLEPDAEKLFRQGAQRIGED